ncbi:dienelactone hydrolase family protein [Kitasatospora sp. CM 4170]|uniref:Dienelactone hydrolase family protein n=1 Tax=Kitasatospora aburaviensis TaxID=67265 RepID=A0ABW1EPN3_9ACTN|nr:dienelactone hydrolase family protein [Kitasatospora sp. CM 4170]WNM48573.1 dienelactone hydrolase family protein [Kitasatospora sp. CM 4170]
MATAVRGTSVDITTSDGTADAYLTRPDDGRAHPGVLFFMSAFGIRPALTAMADRIAAEGYTVLVPNVLYRYGRTPIIELPEPPALISTAADPTLFQRLGPMIEALTPELFARDADAYLGWLAASPLVTDGPVGITGYCLGAGLALRTAGAFPDRVAAAAGFHGAYLATDSPDSPHLVAERVTAELYFGHADQDPSLPAEEIDRFAAALAAAGVKHTCEVYEGARHGFTQTDTVPYHPEGDARHWKALFELLGRAL